MCRKVLKVRTVRKMFPVEFNFRMCFPKISGQMFFIIQKKLLLSKIRTRINKASFIFKRVCKRCSNVKFWNYGTTNGSIVPKFPF